MQLALLDMRRGDGVKGLELLRHLHGLTKRESSMEDGKRSDTDRRFFGLQEVADQLGTSRGFIYSLIFAGDLRSVKLGGRRIIPASEIDRLVEMADSSHTNGRAPRQGGDANGNH